MKVLEVVKYWDSNSIGDEGGRQGGVNSGPDSYGVPEGVQTDGPGFSLCAVPLESLGPVFQDGRGEGMNEQRSRVYWTGV